MLSTNARASRGRMITGTGGQCTVIVDQSGRASTRGTRKKKRKQKWCLIFLIFAIFQYIHVTYCHLVYVGILLSHGFENFFNFSWVYHNAKF